MARKLTNFTLVGKEKNRNWYLETVHIWRHNTTGRLLYEIQTVIGQYHYHTWKMQNHKGSANLAYWIKKLKRVEKV